MTSYLRALTVASAAFFIACTPVAAQWQTPDHSVPVGRGSGTGFKFASPGIAGQALLSNGASSDPTFQAISGAFGTQTANTHLSGPTSGGAALPAFRALVGADLPNPAASTLGGTRSITCSSSNWINTISTSGIPACSQPNFTDLAGSIAIGQISNSLLTNAKFANMAAYTFKMNATGSAAAPTDVEISTLTTKASPAAGDYLMLSDQAAGGQVKKVTVSSIGGGGSGVTSLNGVTGAVVAYFPPQGRITLTSATPVMTTSVSAATSVFYTPSMGDLVPIYDGTNIVPTVFAELTISLGSNWAASTNYDVFIASDSGTVRACTGPAWSNSGAGTSARGTGAGTTELNITKGFYLNNVSLTCRYNNSTTFSVAASRGTYVGTIRTGGSTGIVNYIFGTTVANWGAGDFGLWNMYNRALVSTTTGEATSGGWTYTVANTFRAANGNATARISFVRGLDIDGVTATYVGAVNEGSGAIAIIGIGLNSTTANSAVTGFASQSGVAQFEIARLSKLTGIGTNFVSALDWQNSATSCTYYATAGLAAVQTGMQVELWQ